MILDVTYSRRIYSFVYSALSTEKLKTSIRPSSQRWPIILSINVDVFVPTAVVLTEYPCGGEVLRIPMQLFSRINLLLETMFILPAAIQSLFLALLFQLRLYIDRSSLSFLSYFGRTWTCVLLICLYLNICTLCILVSSICLNLLHFPLKLAGVITATLFLGHFVLYCTFYHRGLHTDLYMNFTCTIALYYNDCELLSNRL